jgi:hypothetical protein
MQIKAEFGTKTDFSIICVAEESGLTQPMAGRQVWRMCLQESSSAGEENLTALPSEYLPWLPRPKLTITQELSIGPRYSTTQYSMLPRVTVPSMDHVMLMSVTDSAGLTLLE